MMMMMMMIKNIFTTPYLSKNTTAQGLYKAIQVNNDIM